MGARQNDKRVAPSAIVAEAGLHQVMASLVDLGWGPVDNRQHDLGTDLLVHVRDERGFDRALLIGAQVKAGESYFRSPTRRPDPDGWWYAEDDTDHFDIWSNHVLPHLLILHDPALKISYWQRVTPDRVVSTGRGAKVLVPRANTLEGSQLPSLLDELARPIGGETNNYDAVAPGDRLRHSILAPFDQPRLATLGPTCAPTEFIAAVMNGSDGGARPKWAASSRRTWTVDFADAIASWRGTGDATALRDLAKCARFLRDKCAATVLYSSSLRSSERHGEALSAVSKLLDGNQLGPTDQAWCLVQRARASIELGDLAGARRDAAQAARSVALAKPHDHVGKTLGRVAAVMLYELAETVTLPPIFRPGIYDPIATWRETLVTAALSQSAAEAYESMGSARSIRFGNADPIAGYLELASLNADLVGDQAEWRRIEELRAKLQLQRQHSDPAAVADAIDRLRRVGSTAAIKVIASHLYHNGPAQPLAASVGLIRPSRISATSARSSLELARLASAHYMDARTQNDLAAVVLQSLSSRNPKRRVARVLQQEVPTHDQYDALASLMSFATAPTIHAQAAALVWHRLRSGNPIDVHDLDRVASQIDISSLDAPTYRSLVETCMTTEGSVSSRVLGLAAAHRDNTVVATLQQRAITGDLAALDALLPGDGAGQLDRRAQRSMLGVFASRIRETISSAEGGSFGYGGNDHARAYCISNVHFSHVGSWAPVLDLLSNEHVNPTDKVGSMRILAEYAPDLPPHLRAKLRKLSIPVQTKIMYPFDIAADGALHALRIAVGSTTDEISLGIQMAFGTHDARVDLARCLGQGRVPELRPLLARLVQDESREVVNEAAQALGRLAASASESFLDALLEYTTGHEGIEIPIATLRGVLRAAEPVVSPTRRRLINRVETHPSRIVRHAYSQVQVAGWV